MDHRFSLVALVLAGLLCTSANAGYAEAIPPPGFGGAPNGWTYKAANASEWLSGTVRTNATLNVGGRAITLPAAMRMAANAPRFAARAMFGGPIGMAAAAAALLLSQNITWDPSTETWSAPGDTSQYPVSTGLEFRMTIVGAIPWRPAASLSTYCAGVGFQDAKTYIDARFINSRSVTGGCQFQLPNNSNWYGYTTSQRASASCPAGWYFTEAGCVQNAPPQTLTEEQFTERLLPYITPEQVPDLVPTGTPLPVDLPIINPTPGANPAPQIKRIPLGDFSPYPSPNSTTSTQYRAPILDIVPSPTQSQPWRVDAQPKDMVKEVPNDQPAPDPLADPVDVPKDDPNPAPTESKDPSLCEKHPDILACQKVNPGDLQAEPVQNTDKSLAITPDAGWGPGAAACPAPRNISVHGGVGLEISYAPLCTFAEGIRPIVIAMAWLASCLTFFGFVRGS